MSDQIPPEIVTNILLRVRAKDLATYRRVSKQWLSIIDDPQFISSQLQHSISKNSNFALFLQDRESPILYWKQDYASEISFFSTRIHYEPTQVILIGSCHGLICYSLVNNPGDFVVLNPSTGEWHIVPLCSTVKEDRSFNQLRAYGFGYDESSDDYKVVTIVQRLTDDYHYTGPSRAEIYSIRCKGFSRTIHLPTADWKNYNSKSIGVFVSGSLHWCIGHSTNNEHLIHAINLVSNTYHQLKLPDFEFGKVGADCLNVGIVDTRLCLCAILKDVAKVGIWVLEEYGEPESWNMIYCVEYLGYFNGPPVTSVGSNGDEILLMIDWDVFAWCDLTKNEDETALRAHHRKLRRGVYEGVFCLGSLVRIFPKDMQKQQQIKKLADREVPQRKRRHPAFLDLLNLRALMYEYSSDEE
ncbi:F-box/kelch-repeat protein At3g06240 [Linum perenne]